MAPNITSAPVAVSGATPPGHTFDTLADAGSTNFNFVVDQNSPIARIDFTGVDRVKGIVIHYRLASGAIKEVGPYGTKPPPGSAHFVLSPDEILISVSGIAGDFNGVKSVLQLNFVKYDKLSGNYTVLGPYGDKSTDEGPPLSVTGDVIYGFIGTATPTAVTNLAVSYSI